MARSHTFHRYSFAAKAKTQTSWLSCMLTNAFLNALSSALIDAIPLSMLAKPRNFLLAWVDEGGSFLARSHTFHRYSLVAKAKTRNLLAFLQGRSMPS
ncbi:MAG: hypothetical protein APF81_12900 [Desulfosporosinus sp. BRH_c37]|nr:MAG: hypothetical protein APF81_12900 [Desulfosporosinus sp. BRH_c37]